MRLSPSPVPVIMAAALALAACHGDPPPVDPPAAASIAGADPLVTGVHAGADPSILVVEVTAPYPDVGGAVIRRAAQALRQIGRAVRNNASDAPPSAATLTLQVNGVDVQLTGRRTKAKLMEADFDMDGLREADYAKLGPAAVMNLADDLRVETPGEPPMSAWCGRYPKAGASVCDMAGVPHG